MTAKMDQNNIKKIKIGVKNYLAIKKEDGRWYIEKDSPHSYCYAESIEDFIKSSADYIFFPVN